MRGNQGKSYLSILIAILVLIGLICAGVGYTVYNQTVYTVDTDDMKNALNEMQMELSVLRNSVSDNFALLNDSTVNIGESKKVFEDELVTINNQIIDTSKAIDTFNEMLNQKTINIESTYEDLVKQYNIIQDEMTNVTENIDSFNSKLESEIVYLSESSLENHIETINTLRTIQGSLSNSNEEFNASLENNIKNINQDFARMEEQNKKYFGNIEDMIGDTNKKLDNSIVNLQGNINDSISNNNIALTNELKNLKSESQTNYNNLSDNILGKYNDLNILLSNNYDSINNSLNSNADRMNILEGKIDQVFQFASNGKDMLASTLTGYDIPTAKDAEFNTINENINLLYTKAYIDGVSSVGSPNVHYEYHQHLDKDGNFIDAEFVTSDIGGCFTVGKHMYIDGDGNFVHTEYNTYGGCFTKGVHNHQLAGCVWCTSSARNDPWYEDDNQDHNWQEYQARAYCNGCKARIFGGWYSSYGDAKSAGESLKASLERGHYNSRTCNGNINCYFPNCNNEINYYESECGFRNGDIERAIIEYR